MIDNDPEFSGAGHGWRRAVRFLGGCFVFLAVVAGLAGVVWIARTVRSAHRLNAAWDGILPTLGVLAVPVATSVAVTWFLFRIGRGLRHGSSPARWLAVALLVPSCIPPLLLFFSAVRGGVYAGAAFAFALLIPPASATLLLTASGTDPLFPSKGAALVEDAGAASSADIAPAGPMIKVMVLMVGLFAMIALLVLSQRP